nr:proton-coupled folate transporter-like [Onthophagus taurus]
MVDEERRNFKFHFPEMIIFLFFFGVMLSEPVSNNFLIYRTCYTILNFNESDCAKLGTKNADNSTAELEKQVQPYANVLSMVLTWPAQIIPAILCLFVGPWSDKNGRKPVMISAFIGFTISSTCQVVISLIPRLSPWYTIIPNLISVLFGGFSPVMMLLLCYVTDITTDQNRGIRLGIFEGVFGLGSLLGTFLSSYIFNFVGYPGVFATTAACNILALLYIVFILPETVNRRIDEDNNIISIENVKDMFSALFKKRPNHLRTVILISITVMMLFIMSNMDGGIFFYYLREKFHWDLQKYTTFKSIRDLTLTVGSFLGLVILHKWLKIHEMIIVVLALILICNGAIVQAIAVNDWQIILAACLRLITGTISPMIRSFISKLVSHADIGKIFSTTVTLETFAMIIGSPAYTLLYNSTLNDFPGAYNLLTASICLVMIILTIIIIILKKNYLSRNVPFELIVDVDSD